MSSGSKKGSAGNDEEEEEEEEEEEDDAETVSAGKKVPELLLANKWDIEKGADPTGWLMSEKLDGVRLVCRPNVFLKPLLVALRTFFDGKQMYSRLGNPFTPP